MFISVPCKKPHDVDLKQPLLRYIKDTYNEDILNNSKKSIEDLNKLREDVCKKIFDKHEHTIELLKKYHDWVVSLESRIPIAENGVIIDFKWFDAFNEKAVFKKNYMKSNSGAFDRLCILFSIGALYSQLAASKSMNNDQDLQYAAKSFQQAAGLFEQVRVVLPSVVQSDPTSDLRQETLILLTNIMIAQAQEAIFIKAEKDNMKSTMVSKIAAQTYSLYSEAYRLVNLNSIKGIFPKPWSAHLGYKNSYFEVMTNLHQSKACADDQNFGEQIARLKLAYSQAKALISESKEAKSLAESIKAMLERAEKDNNCIYHANVPDAKVLKSVSGTAVAKPQPVQCPLLGEEFQDPFLSLVPMGVQMNLDNAQKILVDLIKEEIDRLKEATETCNCMMQSLNLASLSQDEGQLVPKNILEGAKAIREQGGLKAIAEKATTIPDSRQRNIEILNTIRANVDDEENADKNLRAQYGDKWKRKPSDQLNCIWRKEIEKYDTTFAKTTITDDKVLANYEKHVPFFEHLSLPESELINIITDTSVESNSPQPKGPSKLKDNLKEIMSKLNSMKTDRADLIVQLQGIKLPASLRETYMQKFNESGQVIDVTGEMAREAINPALEGPRGCIRESLDNQKGLLDQLQKASTAYFGKSGAITDARSTLLTNLALACEEYPRIMKDLSDGIQFYAEFTNVLLKVQQKVDDFVFARKTEKEELMSDISMDISKATIESAPSAPVTQSTENRVPPARPPPPQVSAPTNPPISAPPQQMTQAPQPNNQPPVPMYPGYGYPAPSVPAYPYGYPVQQPYPAMPAGIQPPPLPYPYGMPVSYPPMGPPQYPGSGYPAPGSGYPPSGPAYPGSSS